MQVISGGGLASGAFVSSGGFEILLAGGTARNTTLSGDSSFQNVDSRATTIDTAVESGGLQSVHGLAIGTTVNSAGAQRLFFAGTASGGTISGGGEQFINSGGTAIGTAVVASGAQHGEQRVNSAGTAIGTILSGGRQFVFSAGAATSTIITKGGVGEVFSGGALSKATIKSGGLLQVNSTGVATSTTVLGGGIEFVLSNGTAGGWSAAAARSNGTASVKIRPAWCFGPAPSLKSSKAMLPAAM
jgi:autotransporter passenger strand-loop-strand repeat protein